MPPQSNPTIQHGGSKTTSMKKSGDVVVVLGRKRTVYTDSTGKQFVNVSKTTLEEYLTKLEDHGKSPLKRSSNARKKRSPVKKSPKKSPKKKSPKKSPKKKSPKKSPKKKKSPRKRTAVKRSHF